MLIGNIICRIRGKHNYKDVEKIIKCGLVFPHQEGYADEEQWYKQFLRTCFCGSTEMIELMVSFDTGKTWNRVPNVNEFQFEH